VTLPLSPAVIDALHGAVDEMAAKETFRGYGPEQGYGFLREKIAAVDFRQRGIDISPDEIFVSDGSKSDTGNIGDILGEDNVVAITNPVYPVYLDTSIMRIGKSGKLQLLSCDAENGFLPEIPSERVDVIYLCYPNNPTGTVMTKTELKKWVDWALENEALILYDAAYEAYVQEEDVPKSIYEIENAQQCAIEFHSFSKNAGFTGLRCSYTVVPKALKTETSKGEQVSLHGLWNRRQSTKFNGTAYIVQRAAEAVYSPQGQLEMREMVGYYMQNAKQIRDGLIEKGWGRHFVAQLEKRPAAAGNHFSTAAFIGRRVQLFRRNLSGGLRCRHWPPMGGQKSDLQPHQLLRAYFSSLRTVKALRCPFREIIFNRLSLTGK